LHVDFVAHFPFTPVNNPIIFQTMKTVALIVAGGSGERFGGETPKQYRLVVGRPLLAWTIARFEQAASIDQIVVVAGEDFLLYVNNQVVNPYGFAKVTKIVPGGATRGESVRRGIDSLPISTSYVAIHDGVRPLVKPTDIDAVVAEAQTHRAAILADSVTDTVKRAKDGLILATLDRRHLYLAQTPQVFQYDLIKEAYHKGNQEGIEGTDDAVMVETLGFMVTLVPSTGPNPKLTRPEDLDYITMVLERENRG
jgi:2-C-methyl-D-erythritol 4-phosphate cytidylyltransferase